MKVKNKRTLKNGAIAGYVYYNTEKKWKWRIIGRKKLKGSGYLNLTIDNIRNFYPKLGLPEFSDFEIVKGVNRYFIIYKPKKRIFYLSSGTSNIFNYPLTFFPCFCNKDYKEYITKEYGFTISGIKKFLEGHNEHISKCVLSTYEINHENSKVNKSFIRQLLNMNIGKKLVVPKLKNPPSEIPFMQTFRNLNNQELEKKDMGKIIDIKVIGGRNEQLPFRIQIYLDNLQYPYIILDLHEYPAHVFITKESIFKDIFWEDKQMIHILNDKLNLLGLIPFLLKFDKYEDLQISSLLGGYWDEPNLENLKNFVRTHDYVKGEFVKRKVKMKNMNGNLRNINSNLGNYMEELEENP